MKLFIVITCFATLILSYGIYDLQIPDIDGNNISLSDFQGKKILFVNIATGSEYANQLGSLEQLYQKYKDSLVIIAVPSNAYGNEPLGNDSIKYFINTNFDTHYLIASKSEVTGDSISPVYGWLTQKSDYNYFQNPVNGDFYKYLINENGQMIAIFASSVDPMDSSLQKTIQTPIDY